MFENWTALWNADWQPVPRWVLSMWTAFYAVFLAYVFHSHGGFLFIDLANLVVHEGGHMLLGWFGQTLGPDFRGGLITHFPVFLQRPVDHVLQLRR